METITVAGRQFQVRPLRRKEVRQLKDEGFTLGALPGSKVDDAVDKVLEMVLSPEEFAHTGDMDNPDVLKIWDGVIKLTWGNPLETKNLSGPGSGSPTNVA